MAISNKCPAHDRVWTTYTKNGLPVVKGGTEELRKKHQERVDKQYESLLKEKFPNEYAAHIKAKERKGLKK